MFFVIIFGIGLVSGMGLMHLLHVSAVKKQIFGSLVINTDDPLKDVFSFEFSRHPDEMLEKKVVIFDVKKS